MGKPIQKCTKSQSKGKTKGVQKTRGGGLNDIRKMKESLEKSKMDLFKDVIRLRDTVKSFEGAVREMIDLDSCHSSQCRDETCKYIMQTESFSNPQSPRSDDDQMYHGHMPTALSSSTAQPFVPPVENDNTSSAVASSSSQNDASFSRQHREGMIGSTNSLSSHRTTGGRPKRILTAQERQEVDNKNNDDSTTCHRTALDGAALSKEDVKPAVKASKNSEITSDILKQATYTALRDELTKIAGGISEEPTSDETSKEPTLDGTPKGPTADGTSEEPTADGTHKEPTLDGTPTEPIADGTFEEPRADGTSENPTADGTSEEPRADGTSVEPTADGTSEEPRADGTSVEPTADGTSKEPTANGTTKEPTLDGTPKEPAADGTPEEPAADRTSEEPTADGTLNDPTADGTPKDHMLDGTFEVPTSDVGEEQTSNDDGEHTSKEVSGPGLNILLDRCEQDVQESLAKLTLEERESSNTEQSLSQKFQGMTLINF